MNRRAHLFFSLFLGIFFAYLAVWESSAQSNFVPPCESPGWSTEIDLKDHTVFYFDGYYYLASIYDPPNNKFAYARSLDLCEWEVLHPILSTGPRGSPDEAAIWAPYVFEESGVYYMYYTGITLSITQRIMLASTTNPADPESWQKIAKNEGVVFTPDHPGMVWDAFTWADCRDPMVIKTTGKYTDTYILYYSGRDMDGGIIGYATGPTPQGPWTDQGRAAPPLSEEYLVMVPESPVVITYQNSYYLFYNDTVLKEERYQVSTSPYQFPGESKPFRPGWAHEVWQTIDGDWFTSYLPSQRPDRDVDIRPINWSHAQPPTPFIDTVTYLYLPVISR